MSVEAADLTALLSQSPNHSRPTGSHELKQLRPFFFFCLFLLPTPTRPPDMPGNHMTRQGPRSLRGCLGAETAWARHRVVVSATPITNTKWWKGTMTAWERERQRYSIKGWVCPRDLDCGPSVCDEQKGIFTLTDECRVSSVRAAVTVWRLQNCMSYCMESTGAFRGHRLPELFFFCLFFFLTLEVIGRCFFDEWSGLTHLSLSLKK